MNLILGVFFIDLAADVLEGFEDRGLGDGHSYLSGMITF